MWRRDVIALGDVRFCRDCAHRRAPIILGERHGSCCEAPELGVNYDVVTGDAVPQLCSNVRSRGRCGREGALWRPRRLPLWRRALRAVGLSGRSSTGE